MALSKKRITKALIRLRGCACWSAPVLFAKPRRQGFSHRGPIMIVTCHLLWELTLNSLDRWRWNAIQLPHVQFSFTDVNNSFSTGISQILNLNDLLVYSLIWKKSRYGHATESWNLRCPKNCRKLIFWEYFLETVRCLQRPNTVFTFKDQFKQFYMKISNHGDH